jgi:hypothetical protein
MPTTSEERCKRRARSLPKRPQIPVTSTAPSPWESWSWSSRFDLDLRLGFDRFGSATGAGFFPPLPRVLAGRARPAGAGWDNVGVASFGIFGIFFGRRAETDFRFVVRFGVGSIGAPPITSDVPEPSSGSSTIFLGRALGRFLGRSFLDTNA